MSNHSTIVGGSTADRFMNCIGSTELIKTVPRPPAGNAAHTGTALHFCMEKILLGEVKNPEDLMNQVIELDELDANGDKIAITITGGMVVEALRPAIDWFDNVLRPDEFWTEMKAEFGGALTGAWGTADIVYRKGTEWGVADWKFGRKTVVAENNTQGQFYLAGLLTNGWFGPVATEFKFHIYQPYAQTPHTEAVYAREELQLFEARLLAAHMKKEAGDTTVTKGTWCEYCPFMPLCDLHIEPITQAMEETPQETIAKVAPEHLEGLLTLAKDAEKWAKSLLELTHRYFDDGYVVQGLKRVVARQESCWTDEKKALNWLRRNKVPKEEIHTKKLISPAKAQTAVKKLGKPMTESSHARLIEYKNVGRKVVSLDAPGEPLDPHLITALAVHDIGGLPQKSEFFTK